MIRNTQQREAIRKIIFGCKRALSVDEIHAEAIKVHQRIGIATVYRTLKSLVESGEVKTVEIGGESARYEAANLSHHHHFKCYECNKVYDINGCVPQLSKLLPKGFTLQSHEITLFGVCVSCG